MMSMEYRVRTWIVNSNIIEIHKNSNLAEYNHISSERNIADCSCSCSNRHMLASVYQDRHPLSLFTFSPLVVVTEMVVKALLLLKSRNLESQGSVDWGRGWG